MSRKRPTKDAWALGLARLTAERGTCARRRVGCILTDVAGHVIATGYNGRPRGFPHCNEGDPCPGVAAPSGTDLDLCEAVHAEANALLQCRDVELIATCYVTVSPCLTCTKLLLNTGCQRIVAAAAYAHDAAARALWTRVTGHLWEICESIRTEEPHE